MTTRTKYVLFGAVGLAAILLLSTDQAKELREAAMQKAKDLRKRLRKLNDGASDAVADFRDMMGSEMEGLSDDARERIETILEKAKKDVEKIKKSLNMELS